MAGPHAIQALLAGNRLLGTASLKGAAFCRFQPMGTCDPRDSLILWSLDLAPRAVRMPLMQASCLVLLGAGVEAPCPTPALQICSLKARTSNHVLCGMETSTKGRALWAAAVTKDAPGTFSCSELHPMGFQMPASPHGTRLSHTTSGNADSTFLKDKALRWSLYLHTDVCCRGKHFPGGSSSTGKGKRNVIAKAAVIPLKSKSTPQTES